MRRQFIIFVLRLNIFAAADRGGKFLRPSASVERAKREGG